VEFESLNNESCVLLRSFKCSLRTEGDCQRRDAMKRIKRKADLERPGTHYPFSLVYSAFLNSTFSHLIYSDLQLHFLLILLHVFLFLYFLPQHRSYSHIHGLYSKGM
jgi:hypothetical protein